MIPPLDPGQPINLLRLVRDNHFNLYKDIAGRCSIISGHENEFKFLMTNEMEWPKMIYDLKLTTETTRTVFEKIESQAKAKKIPDFLIIDSETKTDNFDQISKDFNFIPVMRWPGMALNISETKRMPLISSLNFSISEVENMDELEQWISIINRTLFTREGIRSKIFEPLILSEKFSFLLGKHNGVPVSTMLVYFYEETVGIYMASTLSEFSHRGFMTALLKYTEEIASSGGYKFLTLEANKQSLKLYLSFGFNDVGNFDIYWKKN
jgi:ribosomal protein S18 acetylase RimI-like enzyme